MRRGLALVAVILVSLAILMAIVVLPGESDETGDQKVTLTLPTPGPDQIVRADTDNNLESGEQAEAKDAGIDLHEDTRDETPPGVTPAQLKAGERATDALARKELVRPERPGGAQNYSCQRRPVRNQSALNGRRVGTALHFTVSGPGSGPAIIRLFDTSSFGASSNRLIELAGRCWTLVPNGRKAWAQLSANSAYISIEIVTKDLSRAQWLAAPIIKQGVLASLVRDLQRSIGSPLRFVDPVGCAFAPGITDHDHLECGNTHWDIGQHFPWDVFIKQVRQGVEPAPLTAVQRKACGALQYHRARAHRIGSWSPARAKRAAELKKIVPTGRCTSRYR